MSEKENNLINDIFLIDSQVYYTDKICNDKNKYYDYCNIYHKELLKIYNSLKLEIKKISPLISDHLNVLEKLEIKFNNEIKNEKEYVIFQISYAILRSFTDISHINKEENIDDIYKSDSVISSACKSIENFKI